LRCRVVLYQWHDGAGKEQKLMLTKVRRIMTKRWAAARILMLAAAFGMTLGLGAADAREEPKGELVVALSSMAEMILDGNLQIVGLHMPIFGQIYDGLLGRDVDFKLIPWLAESWKMSEDGLYWEFKLRKGVKFHNGEAFTADDVKATYERILRLKKNEGAPSLIRAGLRVEVVDDYTVRIHTDEPMVIFPTTYASPGYGCVTPKDYTEKVGDKEFGENPVGTGPYRFVERKMGEHVKLEANQEFWHPDEQYQPGIKNLTLKIIPELSTRLAMMKTGEAQLADGITGALIAQVRSTPGLKTVSSKATAWGAIRIFDHEDAANVEGSPFTDVRVRRALNYAVNKQAIVDKIYFGEASPVNSAFLTTAFGYNPEWPALYPYDLDKAKALLKEAGYGDGFETLLNFYVSSSWPMIPESMEAVAGFWKKVGVKATLKQWEAGTYFAKFRDRSMRGLAAESMTGGSTEAGVGGRIFWHGTGSYSTVWTNKEIDQLLDKELLTLDPGERVKMVAEAQKIICDEKCYEIFLPFTNTVYSASEKLDWTPQRGTPYLVGLSRARWK
jgi:peptide/nickel transport system substrate-binding protein